MGCKPSMVVTFWPSAAETGVTHARTASPLMCAVQAPHTPAPLNMWMNIPIRADGGLSFEPPVCKAGDHVLLEARMDAIVAFSACPQDMVPINGADCVPTEAHFQVV